jgi:predicted 3-demethylubiquinone-9 3-methyltransferase (glyoxalase superfamily)
LICRQESARILERKSYIWEWVLQQLTANHKYHFMQKISPFIWFDRNGEDAMNFYLSIFKEAKPIRVARNPPGGPGPEGALLVAAIQLEGQEIILMNGGPGHPQTDAFSLTINCSTQKEVDYYWNKLVEGGGQEIACGWLKDKFGVFWQVTPVMLPELLADPDRAKAGRVMQAMMKMVKLDIGVLEAAAKAK